MMRRDYQKKEKKKMKQDYSQLIWSLHLTFFKGSYQFIMKVESPVYGPFFRNKGMWKVAFKNKGDSKIKEGIYW